MKLKDVIKTILITIFLTALCLLCYAKHNDFSSATEVYEVFIDGKEIGYLLDDNKLYELINNKQLEIKEKYKVSKVYPPENFKIIKTSSYDIVISTPEQVYSKMADLGSFTIEGYTITIKGEKDQTLINVLDKDIFDESIHNFVLSFISEEDYSNYINNTQKEIETTGKTIEDIYFDENISIKKNYISVNDKIYTDVNSLTQFLLFGPNNKIEKHTVESGDTIESISENNKLNYKEFLIANPKYTSKDSLLTIGDKVNITLINPVLTLSYNINEVMDSEIPFEKKVEYDPKKSPSFSEITTAGITGITRVTMKYVVKNGETQGGVEKINEIPIVEKVDQVTTKGGYKYTGGYITGEYVDTGSEWGWPTNYPYVLTSYYGWRWGDFHAGIDISGTGYNSPIYAALDGTVLSAQWEGMCGIGGGYCILLEHDNGYYTIYAHLAEGSLKVKVGDKVSRGQVIAGMGSTGYSTGTHLHFGVSYGMPYSGMMINPLTLW